METIIDDAVDFLKTISPFRDLDEPTLRGLAEGISTEFYLRGTEILLQEGPASDHLRIIKKGAVKVFIRSNKDEEVIIDTRGEGESFGFLSLMSGDKSRANVVAVEDTTCYLVGRGAILRLLETDPAFAEYFLVSFLNKYVDKAYKEMRKKSLLCGGGDRLLFTTPVEDIVKKEIVTAPRGVSIREAAEIMSRNRISSLVLTDPEGIPAGIVTDRDLRDKVVSKGRDVGDPANDIMSVSLIKADARDYCFEALLNMIRHSIHHLLVIDDGKLRGVITNHDLMMLQGTSPISIAREIESQQSLEGLIPASGKINKIVELLLKDGAKASNIARVITEINDRLMRKVIEITEKKLGPPPLDYCWIVFGSEGRKEQTFKTDQDNAIIYADPETSQQAGAARTYFSALALLVREGLLKCGFAHCPADYMASNPRWCRQLGTWKKYFASWISEPQADAVLKSLIFFDFRPVYGNHAFVEELRDSLAAVLADQPLFLGFVANTIIRNTPPLGFLKSFVVEKSGEHKDEFDLKIKGIAPLVDAVRLFALEKGIRETSTLARVRALKDTHGIVRESGEEIEYAFEFLMLLRIRHQLERLGSGRKPDNFINPYSLSNHEKKILKDAFFLTSKLQDLIIERYKFSIW